MSTPYYLKPKDTKLPAGHDDTLDPPVDPTDAETRGVPPTDWAAVDVSKGGTAPPDKALSPPPVDPAIRSVPVSTWPRGLPEFIAGRPVHLAIPVPDLDPDIALWRVVTLNIWPFSGPPSEGEFPRGWLGIDNTSTVWVCTVGGEPGTWASLGGGSGGAFPTFTGSGSPQGVQSAAAIGNTYQDTVHGGIWVAAATGNNHWLQVGGQKPGTGTLVPGVYVDAPSSGSAFLIADPSAEAVLSDVNAQAGTSNGVTWRAGASDGEQDFGIQVGSSGQFSFIFSHLGVFSVPDAFVLSGIPTSDPSVSDEVWNDNGVLVLSGVTQVGALQHDANQVLNVGSTGSDQTLLTTASLAVGTWLINASFIWEAAATGNNAGISMIDGTATATFTGQNAGGGSAYDASIDVPGSLTCLAHITVAGTLIVQGLAQNTGIWLSAGYTAVRIA